MVTIIVLVGKVEIYLMFTVEHLSAGIFTGGGEKMAPSWMCGAGLTSRVETLPVSPSDVNLSSGSIQYFGELRVGRASAYLSLQYFNVGGQ